MYRTRPGYVESNNSLWDGAAAKLEEVGRLRRGAVGWSNRQGPGSTEARTLAAPSSRTGVDKVEGEAVTLARAKGTGRELEL